MMVVAAVTNTEEQHNEQKGTWQTKTKHLGGGGGGGEGHREIIQLSVLGWLQEVDDHHLNNKFARSACPNQ